MNVIQAENLSKAYKLYQRKSHRLKEALHPFGKKYHHLFYALKDVSFQIGKGEMVGIIGKNGSGKSTLLQVITGILTPTEGAMTVQGKVAALLELGAGFNPEFTGMENIYFQGSILGFSRSEMEAKLEDIINFADIGEFIDQPVKLYSSGMFSRLAFAIAIHTEPDILIVDESLSVGDVFFQQKCNIYMRENMENVTKLVVTHDTGYVANMCSRAILLDQGQLLFDGAPKEAVELYIKALIQDRYGEKKKEENLELVSEEKKLLPSEESDFDAVEWKSVSSDEWSGNLDVKVLKYKYFVDGNPYHKIVEWGNQVDCFFWIKAERNISDFIVGYHFIDSYGKGIFGNNTFLSSNHKKYFSLKANQSYIIKFSFCWPQEVQEGNFFLTLGLASGTQDNNIMHCYVNNCFLLQGIATKFVHGVFNHDFQEIDIREVSAQISD